MKHLYAVLAVSLALGLTAPQSAFSQSAQVVPSSRHNSTTTPLRNMQVSASKSARAPFEMPNKFAKIGGRTDNAADKAGFEDPLRQELMGTMAPVIGANFEGSSDDDNSAVLGFRVVPPDTDGDVGPNHYVQWINSITEIFDKDGNTLFGPAAGNVYFQGIGGICENQNDGDPIVLYDELADRFLVSQFALDFNNNNFAMCVAISQTPDPTGAYNQYEFNFGTDFPDYPKLGIWGDSYVMTTRDFGNGGLFFSGLSAVAMDRNAMINGDPATMVRFANAFGGTSIDGYLPGDADGAISGPAVFGGHGDDGDTTFELWELDVDWNNPGAASFNSIPGVSISTFDGIVPQADQPNGQGLDDLSFFTMHRLNVRDFGTHTSMVANHSVEVSSGVIGIRWYEFRNTGGNWTLHQEGTYSPDSDDRWMGSIAINAAGDISLGYSRSSSSMFPSIYFTGQTADQSGSGVMNVEETLIFAGSGSQSGASRWGDYSMMSTDPVDDSFWFTTEYYAETNSFDFKTRIASFVLDDNPGGNNPPVASFSFTTNDLTADFTDASVDSDGTIASWDWDFGDGNSSTEQSPSHTYAAAGTYSVSLTVTDDMGDSDTATQDVMVVEPGGNVPPTADFTFACTLLSCDFTDASTDSDGAIASWSWDFGDGNSSTVQNPNHVFAAAGTYSVSITVTDDMGDSDTNTQNVSVNDGTGGPALHVADLRLGKQKAGGADRQGKATVTIHDESGNVFEGAVVTGTFSGPIDETVSDDTDRRGRAIIVSTQTFRNSEFPELGFCVEDIVAAGFTYDPSANGDPSWDCGAASSDRSLAGSDRPGQGSQETPEAFVLEQNYPNPFNPTTMITFGLPESGHVNITVFNLLGQEVATLVNEVRDAGQHTVSFNANDLSAGVYLYVMQTANYTQTRRMTLLK